MAQAEARSPPLGLQLRLSRKPLAQLRDRIEALPANLTVVMVQSGGPIRPRALSQGS